MKRTIIFCIIFLSVLFPSSASAQSIFENQADGLYKNLSFSKAANIYESLHKKFPQNGKYIQRLAYCYDKMLNYKKALLYYSYLVQIDERNITDYYQFAQLLRIDGNLEESIKWLEKYIQFVPDDKRAVSQFNQLNKLISLKEKINALDINEINGNTHFADMCPAFYNDRLVYSSAKDSFSMVRNEFKWTGQPFLKLYSTDLDPKPDFKESSFFSKTINTRVHEGPVCFTTDFRTIYFTRNSTTAVKNRKSPDGVNNLKIFISRFDGKNWSEPESFIYNSDVYSVGHPAISPDNQTLYFISDMKGGFGETDLYKSQWIDGQWSKPQNLGSTVNTEGKEMFPFVDKEGILYFSSDGRQGMAGLDIYAAKSDGNEQYLIANFGSPLNSKYDDFGFILNTDSLSGYFTSNRPGGAGDDDIYAFSISGIDLKVTSLVKDKGLILPNTQIFLKDENGQVITSALSDQDGLAEFPVIPGKQYILSAENQTFTSGDKMVNVSRKFFGLEQREEINLHQAFPYLTIEVIDPQSGLIIPLAIVDVLEGQYDNSALDNSNGIIRMKLNNETDYSFKVTAEGYFPNMVNYSSRGKGPGEYSLKIEMTKLATGKQFTLENLYYDVDKSNIRPDAALVLNELAQTLLENPEIYLEIGSHTDSRATSEYNLKLSQRRSESVVMYLIGKGIFPDRLVAKGFGESQLINKCADGVECPEQAHQANRRTVIEILNRSRKSREVYYL